MVSNESKVIRHIEIQERIDKTSATTAAIPGFGCAAEMDPGAHCIVNTAAHLRQPSQNLQDHLQLHDPSQSSKDIDTLTQQLQFATASPPPASPTLGQINPLFTPAANLYAAVSNTTALANSMTPMDITALKTGSDTTSIITQPFLDKDWDLLTKALTQTISVDDCRLVHGEMAELVADLNGLNQLQLYSTKGTLAGDLQHYQQTALETTIPKWSFVNGQGENIRKLRSSVDAAWPAFSTQALIQEWRQVDFTLSDTVKNSLATITDVLNQLTQLTSLDLNTTAIKGDYDTFSQDPNATLVVADFLTIANDVRTSPLPSQCIAEFADMMKSGDEWVTEAHEDEVQWVIDQEDKFIASNNDFAMGGGLVVNQVIKSISTTFETISAGLAQTSLAGEHLELTAAAFNTHYPLPADREGLLALQAQSETLNGMIAADSFISAINYGVPTGPAQIGLDRLVGSSTNSIPATATPTPTPPYWRATSWGPISKNPHPSPPPNTA